MRARARGLPSTLLLNGLVVACGTAPEGTDGGAVTRRETVGDTTFVEVAAGESTTVLAIEELAIGALEGPEHLTLGMVTEMVPDREGGVYAFDANVPALRHYDSNGAYKGKLGGQGAGPGEYEDAALGLALRSDGRLVMRDGRNGRLNVYAPDGSYSDSWPVASGLFTSRAMTIDTLDHIYLKILTGRPEENKPWPVGLLHLGPEGAIIDTIPPPSIAGEPDGAPNGRFLPQKHWALTAYGQLVIGVSDDYRFEIRNLDGTVVRVRKAWEPVALFPEEREEWQRLNDWQWETQGQYMTAPIQPIPAEKPAFAGLYGGEDGSIWVHLHVAAEKREAVSAPAPDRPPPLTWVEPRIFDVFDSTGSYLGRVRIPPRVRVTTFSLSKLWGVRAGDFDEQYLVRLHVGDVETGLESTSP